FKGKLRLISCVGVAVAPIRVAHPVPGVGERGAVVGWGEFGSAVVDADFPVGVVDEGVVVGAEEHHVVFDRESAVGVVVGVVGLGECGW
ncbi:hypothetical protein, partial [Sciscionella sediminilitoris]|uniref:hypothetical protein n=1 Tax=Sciscionella sediminilitoris TaxID=1445613 RepID=UPI001E3D7B60